MASGFALKMEARGIAQGDRVMLWGENCAQWAAAFFGCALRGVIVVPMDDGATADFAMRVFQQVSGETAGGVTATCAGVRERRTFHGNLDAGGSGADGGSSIIDAAQDCAGARRHPANRVYFRHHGGAQGRGDYAWKCSGEYRAAGAGDARVPEVRALGASPAVFEPAAAQPRVRTVSGNVPASAARRDCDFSGRVEAFGSDQHDAARTRVGAGECAAGAAVAETENRARPGRPRTKRGVSAAISILGEGNTSCGAGGRFARFTASSAGSSGRLSRAARPSTARPRNSGGGWDTRSSRDMG